MEWIKFTLENAPPLREKSWFSEDVWACLLDERTGKKTVVRTIYAHWSSTEDSDGVQGFMCEYSHRRDEGLSRKEYVRVTHWSNIDVPMPPED